MWVHVKKGETATTAQLLFFVKHAASPSCFALLRSSHLSSFKDVQVPQLYMSTGLG